MALFSLKALAQKRWQRNITAFMLGVCATLTLAPFYLFPLTVVAYGGLFLLLRDAAHTKRALADGFFWGWGFYISGLYWFVIALMTDPNKFAWLIPFALFALTAVIALYSAFACGLFFYINQKYRITTRSPFLTLVVFAFVWTATEYLRGHIFSGFPWNLPGYAFGFAEAPLQFASVVGVYGLSFIVVLLSVMAVSGKRPAAVALMMFVAITLGGYIRLMDAPRDFVQGVTLRLVQANVEQHHKWDPTLQMQHLREHVALTESPGLDKVTHVVWPETAIPFALKENSTMVKRLSEVILPGQYLVTGALKIHEKSNDYDITNSIAVISSKGEMVGSYDKHKLVPFGEFLPGRWLLPEGTQTPVGDRDFARGAGPQTLSWPGLPDVSPLICYEVIFPDLAVQAGTRPRWLLSLTNDAWFGDSTAPHQHLAMARMRSVEQGLPMVRVANTGITAVFDAYGREKNRINLGKKGVLDVGLPQPSRYNTIYARIFD